MSQASNIKDREYSKFLNSPTRANESAIEVTDTSNPFSPPMTADFILRQVAGSVETFIYKEGGASGVTLKTVVVTYTSSSLKDLVSVEVL